MAGLVGLAALLHIVQAEPNLSFLTCAFALAGVAHVIGEATDQLGNHLGPAATGIVQSAVGNLPELFVCIFSLQAGLVTVVQTSLIGSILGNALLVLGLAFIAALRAQASANDPKRTSVPVSGPTQGGALTTRPQL